MPFGKRGGYPHERIRSLLGSVHERANERPGIKRRFAKTATRGRNDLRDDGYYR